MKELQRLEMFDLKLPGRLKVDSLLSRSGLDSTLNLKELVLTEEGRKQIVDTFRNEVFILLPRALRGNEEIHLLTAMLTTVLVCQKVVKLK